MLSQQYGTSHLNKLLELDDAAIHMYSFLGCSCTIVKAANRSGHRSYQIGERKDLYAT